MTDYIPTPGIPQQPDDPQQQPTQQQPMQQQPTQQQPAVEPEPAPYIPPRRESAYAPTASIPPVTGPAVAPQSAYAGEPRPGVAPVPVQTAPAPRSSKTPIIVAVIIGAAIIVAAIIFAGLFIVAGSDKTISSGGVQLGNQNTSSIEASSNEALSVAVAEKVLPSVVSIDVAGATATNPMTGQTYEDSSSGSGVIIRKDGYILTNYHVIEGGQTIKVTVGTKTYTAKVVGTDSSTDLAVLKIEGTNFDVIDLGTSKDLKVGQYVMALGSPFGLSNSVTTGIISALGRSNTVESQTQVSAYVNLIQTDAAVNPGNSGGALVNSSGQLIGINTLISSTNGSSAGVGFAIPVDTAIDIAQQLISNGKASHPFLGVSTTSVNAQLAQSYSLPSESGAYVIYAADGSPAAKAGLARGDIIVSIGGKKIETSEEVFTSVREHKVGDKIKIEYYRGKSLKTVEVTLVADTSVKSSQSTQDTQQNTQQLPDSGTQQDDGTQGGLTFP